jgi:hypothetical protein
MGGRVMRRIFYGIWIPIVGVAVVTSVASCGDAHAPTTSNPSSVAVPTPSRPPDPEFAFRQYDQAERPFVCTTIFDEFIDATQHHNYAALKDKARAYRDVVTTWDTQLAKIAFPEAQQPIIDGIRKLNATELTGLNALAEVDVNDADHVYALVDEVEAANSSVYVEGDRLRAALGHPEHQAGVAADQMNAAWQKFLVDVQSLGAKWKAAIAANDLEAAKSVNASEEDAAQRLIDQLGVIDWPAGFEGQANAFRDDVRGIIDFDRHQVDVPSAAQIVEAPQGSANAYIAAEDAESALWDALVKVDRAAGPSKCTHPA